MATTIRYKKDADGDWGVIGPVDQITPGARITVTKRGGETKTETVATVADQPDADGNIFAWLAYTPPSRPARPTARITRPRRPACVTGGNCSSFGTGRTCGGHDCDGY
jgi:hypothetical protein